MGGTGVEGNGRAGGCEGGKRFTAPAQDVESLIDLVSRDGKDYVRDASIPADYFEQWKNL